MGDEESYRENGVGWTWRDLGHLHLVEGCIDEALACSDRLFGGGVAFFVAPEVRKGRNTQGAKAFGCGNGQDRPIPMRDLVGFGH